MGVRVEVREGESIAEALRRFHKAVFHASIKYELDWHRCYLKPGEERRGREVMEVVRSRAVKRRSASGR
ncbi:MAG: 30S ribosomal protein S21 [Gemmataceae bacterium]